MNPKVTYTDIARAAGVSRMAVSLALRNSPEISRATADRIRKKAAELGYRPDPEINRLMSYLRTAQGKRADSVVAFLDPWPNDPRIPDRLHTQLLLSGVRERAGALGFRADVLWLKEPGMTQRRMNGILEARGIRGLLIPPIPAGRGHLSLAWERFTTVVMDDVMKPDLHRVTADQYANMMTALRRLRRLGYRRIGFVERRFLEQKVDHAYSAAFYWHNQQLPAAERVAPLIADRITDDLLARYVRKHRPEVVVGMLVPQHLAAAGFRVPDEVAVASLYNRRTDGTMAGIDPLPEVVGSAAMDLLLGGLMRNETGVPRHFKHVRIRGVWVDGASAPAH